MSTLAGFIVLIGRVLFVIFPAYVSGYTFHIKNPKAAEGYSQSVGFPFPRLAGYPAGLWLVLASISVGVGIWPDIGALMFAVFVIPSAWYFHRFWTVEDPAQRQAQTMFFWRNMIMLGASLVMFGFFASVGAGLRFAMTRALIDLSP
jgi:putative oxidoreductase